MDENSHRKNSPYVSRATLERIKNSAYADALPIEELKGTKPTEKIDLSNKELGPVSAIIIASCIKDNGSLKELRCAQSPPHIP